MFRIARIKPGTPAPRYYLEDWDGEAVIGHWYANELQLVDPEDPTARPETFLVSKVHKERTRKGVREAYVSWVGWPSPKFDGWVPLSSVTQTFD